MPIRNDVKVPEMHDNRAVFSISRSQIARKADVGLVLPINLAEWVSAGRQMKT